MLIFDDLKSYAKYLTLIDIVLEIFSYIMKAYILHKSL